MARPVVLLGMSGGVDSSVAAALLVRQGYEVHGVTLQVWEHEDENAAASKKWQERGCCKVGLAKYVADRLCISHEVIDARAGFRRDVIDDFLDGYAAGTTPNPCVRCNERVKIKHLIDLAKARHIPYVATGHYVRISAHNGHSFLARSADPKKDQSYFLYRLASEWLPHLQFPVGDMHKNEVWEEAETLGLPTEEMLESQEICFVSQGDYRTFIEMERPEAKRPGQFVGEDGRILGRHDGIAFYTPGQRRGLGISTGERLYVQRVEPSTNTVVLAREVSLCRDSCEVSDLNLFAPSLLAGPTEAQAKIRYATPTTPVTIYPLSQSVLRVRFHEPQRALSPGQSAVFYQQDLVLGGGIIQSQ